MKVMYNPINYCSMKYNENKMENIDIKIIKNLSKFLNNEINDSQFDNEMNSLLSKYNNVNITNKALNDVVTSYKLVDDSKSMKDYEHLSHSRFRYDAMKALNILKNDNKYKNFIKDDYSKYFKK